MHHSNVGRAWIAFWSVFALCAAGYLFAYATISADISVFLAQRDTVTTTQLEGPAARIWMLGVKGESTRSTAQASRDLAANLKRSGLFAEIQNGENDDQSALDLLFEHRYFLDQRLSPEFFSTDSLRRALQERMNELESPLSSMTRDWLANDPTGSFSWFLDTLSSTSHRPKIEQGVWFSDDRSTALLLAETRAPAMELDTQQIVRDTIETEFRKIAAETSLQLIRTGVPAVALDTKREIEHESRRLSIVASLAIIGLLAYFFRSARRVVVAAAPLLGGVLAGAVSVSFVFGSIHGITLAFGITLLGVAVDYPIHLFSHGKKNESLAAAARNIWPTLRLGVVTTALGYTALATSSVQGLAQLGVFSIAGLLTAAWISRSLLPVIGGRTSAEISQHSWIARQLIARRTRAQRGLGILVATSACIFLLQNDHIWSTDIANLSPLPAETRQQHNQMRLALGISESPYFIRVTGASEEQALQRSEAAMSLLFAALESTDLLGFDATALLLPSVKSQHARQQAVPDAMNLRNRLEAAAIGLPFKDKLFEPFIDDLERFRIRAPLTRETLETVPVGRKILGLLTSTTTAAYAIIRLTGVKDPNSFRERVNQSGLDGVEFVDLKKETEDGIEGLRREALVRIGAALVIISVILAFSLRSGGRLVGVVVPVACAVATTAAVSLLLNGALNLFHLISMLLVAGISVDYGLFFSRRTDRTESLQTAHGLMVCCLSTVTVFAILATTHIPVLQHIGVTVAVGVIAAFIYASLFSRPLDPQITPL